MPEKNKKIALILVFGAIILFFSFFYWSTFIKVSAQTPSYEFFGWAWSENYGWFSLSSKNCKIPGCTPNGVDYKVKLDSNNKITGYAWSSNIGWVCFGSDCDIDPPSGLKEASFSSTTGEIIGWAKVLSLGDKGWIKLGSESSVANVVSPTSPAPQCFDCAKKCVATTTIQIVEGEITQDVVECTEWSETDFESCKTCYTVTRFDNANIPAGTPDGLAVWGGNGAFCSTCSNCSSTISRSGTGSRIACSACNSCKRYGSNMESGIIHGWGWNGNGTTTDGAVGWLNFPYSYTAGIVFPWLETQYGSLYSTKKVTQKAAVTGNNATYCILAESINSNIKSLSCESPSINNINISYPGETKQVYRNALGKIDVKGLLTTTTTASINKYGNKVEIFKNDSLILPWNNKVYYVKGLIVGSNLTILNGTGDIKGNGTIIVDGDLVINANIRYQNSAVTDIKNLASVAWIVLGDVIVGPNVTTTAGAFIVLGRGGACQYENETSCSSNAIDYPKYKNNGYGIFFSGSSSNSLTVLGMIAAKSFDFRRSYADLTQGAERIIYDGRLIANPPPGLKGFAEGLPIIRDFSY